MSNMSPIDPAFPPSQPVADKSRFIELAGELLGAKLTSEIIREAWAAMPPESKKEIARALCEKAIEAIKKMPDWDMQRMLGDSFTQIAADVMHSHHATMREEVNKRLETTMPALIENLVRGVMRELQEKTEKALRGAVDEALEKMRSRR